MNGLANLFAIVGQLSRHSNPFAVVFSASRNLMRGEETRVTVTPEKANPSVDDWMRVREKQKHIVYRLAFRTAPLVAVALVSSLGIIIYARTKGATVVEWIGALSLAAAVLLAARVWAIWRSIAQQLDISRRAIQDLQRRDGTP